MYKILGFRNMQKNMKRMFLFLSCWGDLIPQTGEFRLTLAIHRVLTGLRVTVIWYSHYRPAWPIQLGKTKWLKYSLKYQFDDWDYFLDCRIGQFSLEHYSVSDLVTRMYFDLCGWQDYRFVTCFVGLKLTEHYFVHWWRHSTGWS